MSVMLPQDLVFVLNLIGFNWPQADEDKLKQSAQHWREYASELEHVTADTNRVLVQVRADNSGESIDALEQHWQDFAQHMHSAHDAAGTIAEVLDDFALAVEVLKGKVVAQLLILAAELAATTGAAFLTFGVAEAAAPEEIVATQGFMRWVTGVAIQKVEHLVVDKVGKKVVEHFLSIKNGLKALKASRTALKDFGKGVVKAGERDLEHANVGSITKVNPRLPGEPGYGSGVPNRFENCARCAVATDRTLAGKLTVAEPSLATSPRWIEKEVGGRFGPATTHQAIKAEMAAAGPKARGIVIAYGPRAGDGHAFNVANQGGVVRFLDGQAGGLADLSPWTIFRVLRTN